MPGIPNGRKRASSALDVSDEESEASYGSSGGKRARHAQDASESPAPSNDSDQEEEAYENDVHQPGSIVRVKLKNFVTYTAAEFHLGPSLNMIIGPNGTGKSTLVCAICLGLGWATGNLGRAKDIGDFVKHGADTAEIEIELAASADQQSNPVIRRVIRKEGNKSSFFIDRRGVAQKDVTSLAKKFSIQIDNLCQFLPQDRVVEFAKLEPIELLMETERAAAPEYMIEWHKELKELRQSEIQDEIQRENEARHLKGLQDKQDATRSDVEKWQERQKLVATAAMLEKCRPMILSKILLRDYKLVKEQHKAEKNQLRQYQAEVEPAKRAQREMEAYRDQIAQIQQSRKKRFEAGQKAADAFLPRIETEQNNMTALASEIDAEKNAEKQRKQDIRRHEGDIARLQSQIDTQPVEYSAAVYEERVKVVREKQFPLESRETELQDTMRSVRDQVIENREQLQRATNQRKVLDTQTGKQDSVLKKWSPETHTGWQWLEKNKADLNLQEEVYAPAILSCSVPDSSFAGMVESFLRLGDVTAITCTNQRDTKIVSDKLLGARDKGGLGLHNISIRTSSRPLAQFGSPTTDDALRDMGFDGWILDHIKGPEPVLAMLCQNAQLNSAAYARTPIPNAKFDQLPRTKIKKCVNGNEVCTIKTRAEYGGASSIFTDQIKPPRFFTDQPVDTDEKRRLDEALASLKQEGVVFSSQHEAAKTEYQDVVQQKKELEEQKKAIRSEQAAQRAAFITWQGIPKKIESKQAEIQNIKEAHAESYGRIKAAQNKAEESSLKVARLTVLYANAVTNLRGLHDSYVEAEIRLIEASSEVEGYLDDNRQMEAALRQKQQRVAALEAQKTKIKAEYHKHLTIANQYIGELTDEEFAQVHEWSDFTTEQLEDKINENALRLSMLAEGNPNAINAYNEREKVIKGIENKVQGFVQSLEATRQKFTEIRAKWEPKLDKLVAKISDGFAHNFQQIGCAGQVGIHKDEDFENWAIRIQVRFRENESLQILDSHRQSGGERAVSTIFYLMALQDLARSPFRVVDEINQGMDPRNERMVHERMVDIACQERTSQYFLITPKLLNDLKFHPKMKVHCIASGEHMPDSTTNLDFQQLSKVALRVRKGIVA